jgi:hypothetical protein
MWALVVDGAVELVRDELPSEVMDHAVVGVAPDMVTYTAEAAAADGWREVALSESPGEGYDPLLVVAEDGTVSQTWVES